MRKAFPFFIGESSCIFALAVKKLDADAPYDLYPVFPFNRRL